MENQNNNNNNKNDNLIDLIHKTFGCFINKN